MDKKGVLAALREIEADATLPNQQDAEVDNVRIGNQWPGIKAALVKIITKADGKRNMTNVAMLNENGFHTLAMRPNRSSKVPIGRVKTTKGVIVLY